MRSRRTADSPGRRATEASSHEPTRQPPLDAAPGLDAARSWALLAVARAEAALRPLADPQRAGPMAAYMKGIAPFLGVPAPARRRALRAAWADLRAPSSDELGAAALALAAAPERELHYAAADLIARHHRRADPHFLDRFVDPLLAQTPWWDTVDALGSAAIAPLCRRFDHAGTVDRWSASQDRWRVRAALQHQRGWGPATDVARVLTLCARHWADPEFFVAKAIGWALRDLTRIDPLAVRLFLAAHPTPNAVASREATRGLRRLPTAP